MELEGRVGPTGLEAFLPAEAWSVIHIFPNALDVKKVVSDVNESM